MFATSRLAKVAAATAVLMLGATGAWADTFYNALDNSIDADHEWMTLTYDSSTGVGSTGTTTLAIQVDGRPDHPGCNIQGGGHWVTIAGTSSRPDVATVELSQGGRFDKCTDTVLATVTARGLSAGNPAVISFAIDRDKTSNDPHLTFRLEEATFEVNVIEGSTGGDPGTRCNADPAAPAWAAAILKASGVKPNSSAYKNYISQVAGAMTQRAEFGGYAKNAHPQYETAVLNYLKLATGNSGLVMGTRPGWECSPAG